MISVKAAVGQQEDPQSSALDGVMTRSRRQRI
jgi:hypothetical protein